MDLPYFLETVDLKHRYGSNLRAYHTVWKNADTHENFFYWLDFGDGRNLDLKLCSREQLDREQVRYLSRDERLDYLVQVDSRGLLCWAKNTERIDTTEEWRDSIRGIVRQEDEMPTFRESRAEREQTLISSGSWHKSTSSDLDIHTTRSSSTTASPSPSTSDTEMVQPYPDDMTAAKGLKKLLHVTPSTILNHLMRKSVKKKT